MVKHRLPNDYPSVSAMKGQRYFYEPGQCWVESYDNWRIELCDWSPDPDYGDEEGEDLYS